MATRSLGMLFSIVLAIVIASPATAEDDSPKLKLDDCPKRVQKTLLREAAGAKIEKIEKESEDGKTIFEAEVEIDDEDYVITVLKDGTLLAKSIEDEDENEDEDEGEDEEEGEQNDDKHSKVKSIKLADCPAKVRKTLKREANGAEIETVDIETKDGKKVYETDVRIDGKNYEIDVSAHGKLISKSLDEENEDEEEEDNDEK